MFSKARASGRHHTADEKDELKKLSAETKAYEKKIANTVYDTGNSFFLDIINKVNTINQTLDQSVGSGSLTVIQAEQQADSCIAARANCYISHIILTADSDQAVLLGSNCVSIKLYYFNNNDNTINRLDVFCATSKTLNQIASDISLPLSSKNYVAAKYKLFDDINDYKVRALIAVGIGCDVFPSGVPDVGAKTMHDFILKLKEEEYNMSSYYYHIMKMYCQVYFKKPNNISSDVIEEEIQFGKELAFENMINIFVESYLYEPCNYFTNSEKVPQAISTYIHDAPSSLHLYNQAFKRDDLSDSCRIKPGGRDDVDSCVGPGNGEHFFLITEGQHFCLSCARSICNHCILKKNECFVMIVFCQSLVLI